MKIIHRYLLAQLLRNLAFSLVGFTALFLVFDFFDRIDNIIPENASAVSIVQYFLFKIPLILNLMLPVAVLVAVLFTIGILSKNSEITAMRASGMTVFSITKPLYLVGLVLSLASLLLNETAVPYSTRRVKEIYNIDIRKKNLTGGYSQSDLWWRNGENFYSVDMFDSRTNTLFDLVWLRISPDAQIQTRVDADEARWLDENLGWSMKNVRRYRFNSESLEQASTTTMLPLTIEDQPRDFYDVKTDASTMSYHSLKKFLREQRRNGINVTGYFADLYEKLAFPFIIVLLIPIVIPFALKPARSGSMALSFVAAFVIGFSYYAIHSFSLALGRAEILPPMFSAWVANIVMAMVALVLSLGAESPH